MKYILVVGDGMADVALKELGNKTPLQTAEHPNMNLIASKGSAGLVKNVPPECNPGTEVAFLSIFGHDPRTVNTGRGPLEAAGIGVKLGADDIALRCNFVTVTDDGVLRDHSAGHISSEESRILLEAVKEHYEDLGSIEFYPGVSYRHLLVLRGRKFSEKIVTSPPHDFLNTPIQRLLVKASAKEGQATAENLNKMILGSKEFLTNHPVNQARVKAGKNPGNMIWPWGQGRRPSIKTLQETTGLRGAAISAVDIVNGIGRYVGLDIVKVPGATGYFDTNYEGKADYALKTLEDHDFVLVHVEAPDEASHAGDARLKVKTIEDIDRRLLGPLLKGLGKKDDYTIMVMADHVTQTSDGAHSRSPVPYAIYSTKTKKSSSKGLGGGKDVQFDEVFLQERAADTAEGKNILSRFLKQGE
ncbi:MAG: cofactor-independent phosphoglycerate mutase [Thaumarchaeota archaeon]|nr:cofactor-independent phosphoglycerate mutase [Nitrososphaerota archaeon]MCL5318836.1 cofactor-independent phosphoglycerate mutase [Nitrososphaerota archaeon]